MKERKKERNQGRKKERMKERKKERNQGRKTEKERKINKERKKERKKGKNRKGPNHRGGWRRGQPPSAPLAPSHGRNVTTCSSRDCLFKPSP